MKHIQIKKMSRFGMQQLIENKMCDIQGIVKEEMIFRTNKGTLIASLIIEDVTQQKIELIAWHDHAEFVKKSKIKVNKLYIFKNVKAINNKSFRKTKHDFKLVFELPYSKFVLIKNLEFMLNDQIFIKENDVRKNKKPTKTKQLSIKNWINRK